MDFGFDDDQEALRDLARQILDDHVTNERLKELEAGGDGVDHDTWKRLADAGIVGIALPEDRGGGGLGFVEAAIALEEIGRHVAPVPYLWTVVAALAVAEFGSDEWRARLLPDICSGNAVLTSALSELANDDPAAPTVRAAAENAGWRLSGEKQFVPFAALARTILVPATTGDATGVFLVDPHAEGVALEESRATNREPVYRLTLDSASGELLGELDAGAAIVDWIVERATAGLCVMQAGICERALRMTADYTSSREQFDHPIAAFQAVSQRAGDAYVDAEAVRLTAWQAAWRIAEGLPATDEIAIAKFWSGEGASRVVHAAQHLHGGIGVDTDYPLHRYFTWARWIELTLGSSTQQLRTLGASIASG